MRSLVWLCVLGAGRAARVTNNLLVLFDFTRAECEAGRFADSQSTSYVGTLLRDNSSAATTACTQGVGLTVPDGTDVDSEMMSAAETMSDLVNQLDGADGMTIEMWLKPHAISYTSDHNRPIFSISHATQADADDFCVHGGVSIEQKSNGVLEVVMRANFEGTDDNTDNYCEEEDKNVNLKNDGYSADYHHLVFVVDGDDLIAYLDGTAKTYNGYLNHPFSALNFGACDGGSSWSSMSMQFFANAYRRQTGKGDEAWAGGMYMFAMYKTALSASQVSQNYAAKLVNSAPRVSDVEVTVNEDGEDASNLATPALYQSPFDTSLLRAVVLDAVDIDDDPSYVNYDATRAPMVVRIQSLPAASVAQLYTLDGTEITAAGTSVSASGLEYSVLVRPAFNAYSGEGTFPDSFDFTFDAVDGETDVVSKIARVTVSVAPVNDPPVPTNTTVSSNAGQTTVIELSGTDVDEGDVLAEAFIERYPTQGKLAVVYPNGTVVDAHFGSGALPKRLPSLKVAYLYDGPTDIGFDEDGVMTVDDFAFSLADAAGARSVTEEVTVRIHTPFHASQDGASNVYEETKGGVTLKGSHESDVPEPVCFRVLTLPAHGTLTDAATGAVLAAGDTLDTSSSPPNYPDVAVDYEGFEDYFNYPSVKFNGTSLSPIRSSYDTFDFTTFACDDPSLASVVATAEVQVTNVNDVVNFTANTGALGVYAIGAGAESALVIPGLRVEDKDHDVDPVRVYIHSSSMYSSFSLERLSEEHGGVYFVGTYCNFADLQCSGDGDRDSSMVFVAQPSTVNHMLQQLSYECSKPDIEDLVTITVYDGEGGNCMYSDYFPTQSLRDGCKAVTRRFVIAVGQYAAFAEDDTSESESLPWQVLAAGAGAVLLFMCLMCMCCMRYAEKCLCYYCCGKKAKKKKKKKGKRTGADRFDDSDGDSSDDDDDDDDDEDERSNSSEADMGSGWSGFFSGRGDSQFFSERKPGKKGKAMGKAKAKPSKGKPPSKGKAPSKGKQGKGHLKKPPKNPEDDPGAWEAFETDEGKTYFYCEATGKTQWTQPEFV